MLNIGRQGQMNNNRPLRVGLFGIGLDAYWPQFKGLKQRLESYVRVVRDRLKRPGVEVVNLGLIDSPPNALEAGHRFRQEDVDLIFLHVTTYALSSTVLPVVQRAKVPVIVLNLQPALAIDYANFNKMGDRTAMTGEWQRHNQRENCNTNLFEGNESRPRNILCCLHDKIIG